MIQRLIKSYDVWVKGRRWYWWMPFFVLMVFLAYQILLAYAIEFFDF